MDRFAETENADIVVFNQNMGAMAEVGIVCSFARAWGWFPDLYGKLLAAATGVGSFADVAYLRTVAERIVNLERAFNVREGFGLSDDRLPERMAMEPLETYGAAGQGQTVRELSEFLDRYYKLRGWTEDGAPTAGKLEDLGLSRLT